MERRRGPRVRCLLPCGVVAGRKIVEGIVRNLSEGGLALEAPVSVGQTGDVLELRLEPPRRQPVEISAVVWHLRTARTGDSGPIGRFGMVLSEAGEEYFALVASLLPKRASPPPPRTSIAPPLLTSFSVQVAEAGSPRTRRILVRAIDAGHARQLALEEIGPGWSIVAVAERRT